MKRVGFTLAMRQREASRERLRRCRKISAGLCAKCGRRRGARATKTLCEQCRMKKGQGKALTFRVCVGCGVPFFPNNRKQRFHSTSCRMKAQFTQWCAALDDAYVKKLLCGTTSLRHRDLPEELIIAKRLQLQLTRLVKRATTQMTT